MSDEDGIIADDGAFVLRGEVLDEFVWFTGTVWGDVFVLPDQVAAVQTDTVAHHMQNVEASHIILKAGGVLNVLGSPPDVMAALRLPSRPMILPEEPEHE